MLVIAQEGDYTKLKILYPEPFKRNIFIENLYSFSNDFGNSPVSFSEYRVDQNKFVPVYMIQKFKTEVKKELITEIIAEEISVAEEGTGYAKVRLKSNKKGKLLPRITQLYRQKRYFTQFRS